MTATTSATSAIKRIALSALAAIIAITLAPTPQQAHAATGGAYTATSVATQGVTAGTTQAAKTKLASKNVTASTLTYTGKALKPKVTVKAQTGTKQVEDWHDGILNYTDGKPDMKTVPVYTTLKQGRDYTLTVKNSKGKTVKKPKARGVYKAIVTGKGAYTGSVTKSFKVCKETVYFTYTSALSKKQLKAAGVKNRTTWSAKYRDTSATSGVLSFKGTMRIIPRSWAKFEIHRGTRGSSAHATIRTDKIGDSRYRSKMKTVKAKSFTITTGTQCYDSGGNGIWLKHPDDKYNYRLAGWQVANSKSTSIRRSYPVVIVVRDGKVTKLGVDKYKSDWSNGY